MFRKMPFMLLLIVAVIAVFGHFLPLEVKTFLYSVSLSIKSLLIFLLPFIIFSFLFKTTLRLTNNATRVILLLLAAICLSNFISTLMSHFVGRLIYQFDLALVKPEEAVTTLLPYWTVKLPKLLDNDKALFSGLVLGILGAWLKYPLLKQSADILEKWVSKILSGIGYLIPCFIAGFLIKLQHEGLISSMVREYAFIFMMSALAQFGYILALYFFTHRRSKTATLAALKNMLPAAIAGFSTLSSASAMPLTLLGVEKNSNNPVFSRSIIPLTVNIHLIGDCFAIPIFAYAILKNYGLAEPLFMNYLIFACYFVIAKFSVAGVPGGGIFVMLPILEQHLGFNAEMLSMITALYLLFDPMITCANVLGNGAFALIMEKSQRLFSKKPAMGIGVKI